MLPLLRQQNRLRSVPKRVALDFYREQEQYVRSLATRHRALFLNVFTTDNAVIRRAVEEFLFPGLPPSEEPDPPTKSKKKKPP